RRSLRRSVLFCLFWNAAIPFRRSVFLSGLSRLCATRKTERKTERRKGIAALQKRQNRNRVALYCTSFHQCKALSLGASLHRGGESVAERRRCRVCCQLSCHLLRRRGMHVSSSQNAPSSPPDDVTSQLSCRPCCHVAPR